MSGERSSIFLWLRSSIFLWFPIGHPMVHGALDQRHVLPGRGPGSSSRGALAYGIPQAATCKTKGASPGGETRGKGETRRKPETRANQRPSDVLVENAYPGWLHKLWKYQTITHKATKRLATPLITMIVTYQAIFARVRYSPRAGGHRTYDNGPNLLKATLNGFNMALLMLKPVL